MAKVASSWKQAWFPILDGGVVSGWLIPSAKIDAMATKAVMRTRRMHSGARFWQSSCFWYVVDVHVRQALSQVSVSGEVRRWDRGARA